MYYQTLAVALEQDIAILRLNRPEDRNAMNAQMRAELTDAIRTFEHKARVIVITGAQDVFCAGQDLGDNTNLADIDLERVLRDEYWPMLNALKECSIPIIAAVNGAAVGAGANLALAADVVIASQSAYFTQAHTRIGLMPDGGSSYFLPRLIGHARAMGVSLFGDKISAQQAVDWGMIYEAVPQDEFEAHWRARATHLALGPTVAYQNIKQALRASIGNTLQEQLTLEAHLQDSCGKTRDFKEGTTALLNKHEVDFQGR